MHQNAPKIEYTRTPAAGVKKNKMSIIIRNLLTRVSTLSAADATTYITALTVLYNTACEAVGPKPSNNDIGAMTAWHAAVEQAIYTLMHNNLPAESDMD